MRVLPNRPLFLLIVETGAGMKNASRHDERSMGLSGLTLNHIRLALNHDRNNGKGPHGDHATRPQIYRPSGDAPFGRSSVRRGLTLNHIRLALNHDRNNGKGPHGDHATRPQIYRPSGDAPFGRSSVRRQGHSMMFPYISTTSFKDSAPRASSRISSSHSRAPRTPPPGHSSGMMPLSASSRSA